MYIYSYTYMYAYILIFLHCKQGAAASASSLSTSTVLGTLGVLLSGLYARFLLNAARLPAASAWLTYVTPLGYAFEALLINEFGGTYHLT